MRKFRSFRIPELIPFPCRKFAIDLQFDLRKQSCSPNRHVDAPANRLKRFVEAKDEVQFLTQVHLIRVFDPVKKMHDLKCGVEMPIEVVGLASDLEDPAHAPLPLEIRIHRRREGFKAAVVASSVPEYRGRYQNSNSSSVNPRSDSTLRACLIAHTRAACAWICCLARKMEAGTRSRLSTTH